MIGPDGGRRPRSLLAQAASFFAVAAVVLLALLLTGPATAAGPGGGWGVGSGPSWSNGRVLCIFDPARPSVNVSGVAAPGTALTATLGTLAEDGPNGSVVATAFATAGAWSVENHSDSNAYELVYQANVSVRANSTAGPLGPVEGLGNASVSFTVRLAEGATAQANASYAEISLNVSGWPWRSAADGLQVDLAVSPSAGASWVMSGPGAVDRVRDGSGHDRLYLAGGAEANATLPTGTVSKVSVDSTSVPSSSGPLLRLISDPAASPASLDLSLRIGVIVGALSELPPLAYAAAAGGAVGTCLGLAGLARRIRRRPSSLVYAEEGP